MKKWYKFLILPVAFSCCSAANNDPSIRFKAFNIQAEDYEAGTFKLVAYVDILVRKIEKSCSYFYSWIDQNGESHPCGGSVLSVLTLLEDYPFYGCFNISIDELGDGPVTFMCEARIDGEEPYQITMPYCNKGVDKLTINESLNEKEITSGYIKESTFIDHSLDYRYVDAFTFLNFEDLRVNELYYDIDISYLRFKYHNGLDDVLKGDFKFAFYDRYNLFPDFPIGENLYRYIPLTCNRDHDECYFTFASTIYYDPITHNSSLIKKDGYLPYHNLMLPFSAADELEFLPCYLELKVNSHTEFLVRGDFKMTYLKKYFGDEEDSKFYERIHQDDEVNVRERTIEITI